MPKLWTDTIENHRRTVRDATIEATADLVAKHGMRAVTMSRIAEETGVGRATLYKYFPDVDAILRAWHEREIAGHLAHLRATAQSVRGPGAKLRKVVEGYATLAHGSRGHHDAELAALLHRDTGVALAERDLHEMMRGLIADAASAGEVRDDVAPAELATFCVHALGAAGRLDSDAAVRRLIEVTLAGLDAERPRRGERTRPGAKRPGSPSTRRGPREPAT